MSDPTASDNPGQVDLSSLRLMPDWVADIGKEAPKQKFREYDDGREDRRGRRDDRTRGGGRPFPGGRDDRGGKAFGGGGERRGRDGFGGKGKGGPRGDRRGGPPQEPREPIPTDITTTIEVEEKAADALAAHIKHTGRAFSMFDASRLVLGSGDRFHVRFACSSERPAGLFRVTTDGAVFLSREEASRYILNSSALAEYYRTEEVELEEPKGEFTSIGVCGMSGTLIGPPSHHSYQTAIIRLHREKFANMPLEDFKRRIRVESGPELVAKWKEQQRKGIRWVHLKDQAAEGAEPLALNTRAEMESHFRRTHADTAVAEVREAVVPGTGPREKLSRVLIILLQRAIENARDHLFEFSQKLGHALEHRGLKLFKRRGGKLFVSHVRPKAIDPGVVFSARVTAIVETVRERPGILLSKLVEAIAAGASTSDTTSEAAAPDEAIPAATASVSEDAQLAVMRDLRWLANEGYVIEYSDGPVFLGVQGEAQPAPKAAKEKPKARLEAAPDGEAVVIEEASQPSESPPSVPVESEPRASDAEVVTTTATPEDAAASAPAESSEAAPPPAVGTAE